MPGNPSTATGSLILIMGISLLPVDCCLFPFNSCIVSYPKLQSAVLEAINIDIAIDTREQNPHYCPI